MSDGEQEPGVEDIGSAQPSDLRSLPDAAVSVATSDISDADDPVIFSTNIVVPCDTLYDVDADTTAYINQVVEWVIYHGIASGDDGNTIADFSGQPSQVVTPVEGSQGQRFRPTSPKNEGYYNATLVGYDEQRTQIMQVVFSIQVTPA